MDEIIIKKWCDIHAAEDEAARVEAVESFTVLITEGRRRGQPRLLVTCPDHSTQVRAWKSLIRTAAYIDQEEAGEAASDQRECPACGSVMSRQGIVTHLVDVHGAQRIKQPAKCPDCGGKYGSQTTMVAHRRRHGYDYADDVAATVPKVRGRRKE